MTAWNHFFMLNRFGPKYQKATFENNKIMDPQIRKVGLRWCQNLQTSLVLFGDTGRGKTYFTFCLIREILKSWGPECIQFFKCKKLDDRLYEEVKKYGSSSHQIERLIEVPLLFLDDFGVDRPTERATRDIYEIIDGRMEWERPTVISTNLSDISIEEVYGKRILSRLKEYVWINFEGKDLRGTQHET